MRRSFTRFGGIVLAVILWTTPQFASAQFIGFGAPGGFGPNFGYNPVGDIRFNGGLTPMLNIYNGQTSLLQYQGFGFYPTNLQVVQAGGQIAFVPQQQPVPIGLNYPAQLAMVGNGPYARVSLAPTFQTPGLGPPFVNTRFIRPVFEGGAVGGSVPFTNILYPPSFSQVGIQTTVGVPLGGRAYVGGYRYGAVGRDEFGAPFRRRVP
ncbi:MAG: hypothetical protein K2R98_27670 [Gemmataceae bacterium]|nr:hypothetical protein [Gemmataceae bacterium]